VDDITSEEISVGTTSYSEKKAASMIFWAAFPKALPRVKTAQASSAGKFPWLGSSK